MIYFRELMQDWNLFILREFTYEKILQKLWAKFILIVIKVSKMVLLFFAETI